MLKFFPKIFRDELLYSMVSRYAHHTRNISTIHINNELFDKYNAILSIELPCRVRQFIDKFPVQVDLTEEEIIYQHTMLSLYSPFLDKERQKKIYNKMLSKRGVDIHLISGSMPSNIRNIKNLRYCPLCVKEELQQYGEGYWHRSHNVEGVYFCYKHEVPLSNKVDFNGTYVCNMDQKKLRALTSELYEEMGLRGKNLILEEELHTEEKRLLTAIAKCIYEVLNYEFYKTDCNIDKIYEIYFDKLGSRSLIYNGRRVNQKQVNAEIEQYYGKRVLKLLDLDFNEENGYSWVKDFFNKKKKANHPLKHIFIINWLYEGDIKGFIEDTGKEYKTIQDSYWPCLNPAATHYKKDIIKGYQIRYDSKKKYHFSVFRCSCGFIYTRKLKDLDKIYEKSRVIEYGDVWKSKLKELLKDEELSISSMAQILQVHSSTIRKYTLEIRQGKKHIIRKYKSKDKEIQRYANRLISYLKEENNISKTDLERRFHVEVSYLKQNNKVLLSQIMERCHYIPRNRVDWDKRDKEISRLVEEEIENVKREYTGGRITINRIGKNIGHLNILQKHLGKLPLTESILIENVEDMDKYKKRKLECI